jgi:hypothetical protein
MGAERYLFLPVLVAGTGARFGLISFTDQRGDNRSVSLVRSLSASPDNIRRRDPLGAGFAT